MCRAPSVGEEEKKQGRGSAANSVASATSYSIRAAIFPLRAGGESRKKRCFSSEKEREALPWRAVVVLALGNNCHFYSICSVFTIAGFLATDLGWVKSIDAAGYVAGWLGSALTLGRIPTAVAQGLASDKYGRRPTLLFTFFWIGVGNTAFGLSRQLSTALAVRFIFLGALNGWVSLVGPLVNEIAGPERQNDVNAYVMAAGAATQLLGPAAAALLYGAIPQYPALAPGLLGTALAMLALILGFAWLPETLPALSEKKINNKASPPSLNAGYSRVAMTTHNIDTINKDQETQADQELEEVHLSSENDEVNSNPDTTPHNQDQTSILPLHRNRPFVLGVTVRTFTGLALFASFDVIPLWAIASKPSGGLALSRHRLAALLTVAAAAQFLFNISAMAAVLRRLGNRLGLRLATATGALGSASIPLVGRFVLSSHASFRDQIFAVAPLVMMYYAAAGMSFNAVAAVINNGVHDAARGKANGVATMFEAIGKAVGPTLGATFFAATIAIRPGPLGAATTFFSIASILTLCCLLTVFLPLSVENPDFRAAIKRKQQLKPVVAARIEDDSTPTQDQPKAKTDALAVSSASKSRWPSCTRLPFSALANLSIITAPRRQGSRGQNQPSFNATANPVYSHVLGIDDDDQDDLL